MDAYEKRQQEINDLHERYEGERMNALQDMAWDLEDYMRNLNNLTRWPMTRQGEAIRSYIRQWNVQHDE